MKNLLWSEGSNYYDELSYFNRAFGLGTRPRIIDWKGRYFEMIDYADFADPSDHLKLWKEVEALTSESLCAGVVIRISELNSAMALVLGELALSYAVFVLVDCALPYDELVKKIRPYFLEGLRLWFDCIKFDPADTNLIIRIANELPFALLRLHVEHADLIEALRPDLAIWFDRPFKVPYEQSRLWGQA